MATAEQTNRRVRLTALQRTVCREWLQKNATLLQNMSVRKITEQLEQELDLEPDSMAASATRSLMQQALGHAAPSKAATKPIAKEQPTPPATPKPKKAVAPAKTPATESSDIDLRQLICQIVDDRLMQTLRKLLQQ